MKKINKILEKVIHRFIVYFETLSDTDKELLLSNIWKMLSLLADLSPSHEMQSYLFDLISILIVEHNELFVSYDQQQMSELNKIISKFLMKYNEGKSKFKPTLIQLMNNLKENNFGKELKFVTVKNNLDKFLS